MTQKETTMTDQQIPTGISPEEAKKAREWALHALNKPGASTTAEKAVARMVIGTVPEPRPTLADMTLDEQAECVGMQADLAQGDRVVILDGTPDAAGLVQVLEKSLDVYRAYPAEVTPRPDLVCMEWPGDKKPVPVLPEGWRLADHKDYGRVIVTKPAPNRDGYVCFVLPADDYVLGYDWLLCKPYELAYLDQGDATDDTERKTDD